MGEPVALCTIISSQGSTPRRAASKMLVFHDGTTTGTIGGGEMESRVTAEALVCLSSGQTNLQEYSMSDPSRGDPGVCGGTVQVYIEPIYPRPRIIVVGGGHVGRAVVHLAAWLGWYVILTDDRPELCTPEWSPGADQYLVCPPEEIAQGIKITSQTAVILTTRNLTLDLACLPDLLQSPAFYIGVIGSRRRWKTTHAKLLPILEESSIPVETLDKIVSPMGLELNGETPEEIALSILAEITMLRFGGHGRRMRYQVGDTSNKE